MKTKALFVGSNGDYNYMYGQTYKIKIEIHKKCIIVDNKHHFPKAYTSFYNLLKDWEFYEEIRE